MRERQRNRTENSHPGILAHPVATPRRQTETKFFWKPFSDCFSQGMFCPLRITEKELPYLLL